MCDSDCIALWKTENFNFKEIKMFSGFQELGEENDIDIRKDIFRA